MPVVSHTQSVVGLMTSCFKAFELFIYSFMHYLFYIDLYINFFILFSFNYSFLLFVSNKDFSQAVFEMPA